MLRPVASSVLRAASRPWCGRAAAVPVPLRSMSIFSQYGQPPLTKIVATIGPVSEDAETLPQVVDAGMRVMRINFSHATFEEAELRMTNLGNSVGIDAHGGHNNFRAVLLDTKGPEIRTGGLQACHDTGDKKAKVELHTGDELTLVHDEAWIDCGNSSTLYVSYPNLEGTVSVGGTILLDDGAVSLEVLAADADGVRCRILNDGEIGARRGVNLPGMVVDLPPMSEKDKVDIKYGVERDMDFVAASFVRKPSDVEEIRTFVNECHTATFGADASNPPPLIISKIESTEALDNLDEIIAASDGIMVARGDLGVEIAIEEVTIWQKEMVSRCNELGKPVIVATQMLETMQKNPRPTRAEVSDVTNAILDGADAVMLSGESANGSYPVESVQMMRSIIDKTERWMEMEPFVEVPGKPDDAPDAAASGAVIAAENIQAACIVVKTCTGEHARRVAMHRPGMPVLAVCSEPKVGRQLNIHRGVHPTYGVDLTVEQSAAVAKDLGFCETGDNVVVLNDGAISFVTAP